MLIELRLNSSCSHGLVAVRTRPDNTQDLTGYRCKWLPPEDREQQAQQDAENDAGDNGKIERGMSALDPNVAGQPSQPLRHEPAPHRQSHQRGHHANDGDEFAKLAHYPKSCANRAEAQA